MGTYRLRKCWTFCDRKAGNDTCVLTGRNAAEELIEMADLVTEMSLVKHPFRSGIKAQIGVEF